MIIFLSGKNIILLFNIVNSTLQHNIFIKIILTDKLFIKH